MLFHLFMHSVVDACMRPDCGWNPQHWWSGQCLSGQGCHHVSYNSLQQIRGCRQLLESDVISFCCIPRGGIRDNMVVLFLIFQGTSVLFSILAAPISIPTNSTLPPNTYLLFLVTVILISVK